MRGRAVLFAAIRQICRGPSGIADLQAATGVSENSVRLLVDDLLAADLIEKRGTRPARNTQSNGGRPALLYGWKGGA